MLSFRAMNAKGVTPILNVSDMAASFAWFAKWGWGKLWDWGTPPTFGAVGSGKVEIFLCQGAQGGGGKGVITTTLRRDWMLLFRRRTCHGRSARCTCDIRMGTCFELARGLGRRSKAEDSTTE